MEILLSYGKRDGKVVHISEIGPEENGKRCKCTCPYCGGELMAKLGNGGRQRHFAHMGETNCDPTHAQQTGLHLLAKEILKENREILLPGWEISRKDIIRGSDFPFIEPDLPAAGALMCKYDSVEIEKDYSSIIADAVIMVKGRPCAVEIAVTHFIDEQKTKKARDLDLPMFEIDLSNMIREKDREKIVAAVLTCPDNRKWIYNHQIDKARNKAKREYDRKYEKAAAERKAKDELRAAQNRKNILSLKDAFLPDNYRKIIKSLRNEMRAGIWLKRIKVRTAEYPFYMDIPITGEFIFNRDRRILQGQLFEDYVYRGTGKDDIREIADRLYIERNPIVFYECPLSIRLTNSEEGAAVAFNVIKKYFEYLELLGFVSIDGTTLYSRRPDSMEAPNKEVGKMLTEILSSVDRYAPIIDSIIEKELQSRLAQKAK